MITHVASITTQRSVRPPMSPQTDIDTEQCGVPRSSMSANKTHQSLLSHFKHPHMSNQLQSVLYHASESLLCGYMLPAMSHDATETNCDMW